MINKTDYCGLVSGSKTDKSEIFDNYWEVGNDVGKAWSIGKKFKSLLTDLYHSLSCLQIEEPGYEVHSAYSAIMPSGKIS
jgi:hypothetical protein